MGQSTDAILCYGIPIDDEDFYLDSKFSHLIDEDEIHADEWTINQELEKNYGCVFISHCSCDYPMYILSVEESKTKAWRGHPKCVTSLDVDPEWTDKIKKAAKSLDILGEPAWWLASDWC